MYFLRNHCNDRQTSYPHGGRIELHELRRESPSPVLPAMELALKQVALEHSPPPSCSILWRLSGQNSYDSLRSERKWKQTSHCYPFDVLDKNASNTVAFQAKRCGLQHESGLGSPAPRVFFLIPYPNPHNKWANVCRMVSLWNTSIGDPTEDPREFPLKCRSASSMLPTEGLVFVTFIQTHRTNITFN